MIRALVSIGTNSTRLLVLDGERVLAAETRVTRLGSGMGTSGTIAAEGRARTLAVIDDYVATARRLRTTHAGAIATSALRRATDAGAFGAEVAARIGAAPRILTGTEEATYSFLGATASRDGDRALAVLDVGGGSVELAVDVPARARANGRVECTFSLEIGGVRLAERHPTLLGARALDEGERRAVEARARAEAAGVLARLGDVRGFAELIAVGGTVYTATGMLAGGNHEGVTVGRAELQRLIDEVLARDLAARKAMPNIRVQRADIFPAGLILIDEACRLLGADVFTATEADLLQGYLTAPAFTGVPLPPEACGSAPNRAAG